MVEEYQLLHGVGLTKLNNLICILATHANFKEIKKISIHSNKRKDKKQINKYKNQKKDKTERTTEMISPTSNTITEIKGSKKTFNLKKN